MRSRSRAPAKWSMRRSDGERREAGRRDAQRGYFPSAAWAAASRAIGTRNGEQLT